MYFEWDEPLETGGCPILGYQLLRDNGLTGNPTTVITT
jgi:hypothetical protein